MTVPGSYDAIVLAGGRSRRMGDVDKLGLELGGTTLVARACASVDGARRLVVVGPADRPGVSSRAVRTQEDPPFAGPAAALGAGLAALGDDVADRVVVLAADVPRAGEVVGRLLEAYRADGVVALSSDGHRQPLLAVYRTAALTVALHAAAPLTDLSANRVVRPLDLVELELPDDVIADVDTPDDLHRLDEETDHG